MLKMRFCNQEQGNDFFFHFSSVLLKLLPSIIKQENKSINIGIRKGKKAKLSLFTDDIAVYKKESY